MSSRSYKEQQFYVLIENKVGEAALLESKVVESFNHPSTQIHPKNTE